jgi:uncharacterized protein
MASRFCFFVKAPMQPPSGIFELSPFHYCLACLCAFLVGFSKSGIAGTGILAIPLMATIFPAGMSTGALLPILIVGDIFTVSYYRRHAVWRYILRALPWAIAGIIAGWATAKFLHLTDAHIKRMIGVIVLAVLAMGQWVNREGGDISVPHTWWFAAILGLIAGFTTMIANAAGPVWLVYLLAMDLPKEAFLGTGGWMFFILNTFKVPFSWDLGFILPESLVFNAQMIPAVALGTYVGIKAVKVIPQAAFNACVKILAVLAALNLLLR